MQLSPTRRSGEPESAYSFRYAWFCFKFLVPLGLALLAMVALRPDATRSPFPLLVTMLYAGLGIGTGMTFLAMIGFALAGILAKLFDERGGRVADEPIPPRPAPTRMPRWPWAVIAALWLAALGIGLFAPHQVLVDVAALRAYEALVSHVSNPAGLLGTKSTFPQVTRLYHAVVIWSFPAWLVACWTWMNRQIGPDRTDLLFKLRLSTANRLFMLLTLPLWLGLAYASLAMNHGGDTRLVAFGTSRLQLALFGMLWPAIGAALLALAAFSARRLLRLTWADRLPTRRKGTGP